MYFALVTNNNKSTEFFFSFCALHINQEKIYMKYVYFLIWANLQQRFRKSFFCRIYENGGFLIHPWWFSLCIPFWIRVFKGKRFLGILTKIREKSAPRLDKKIACFFRYVSSKRKKLWSCWKIKNYKLGFHRANRQKIPIIFLNWFVL